MLEPIVIIENVNEDVEKLLILYYGIEKQTGGGRIINIH